MELRKRLIIVVSSLGALTVGAAAAVAVPMGLSIRTIVTDVRAQRQEIDERFAAQRKIRGSMSNFQAIIDKTSTLSSVAIREGRELELVTAIEDVAAARGVEHKLALETANQKELSVWEREIPMRIEVTGPFGDVLQFLNDVERLPYAITVDSFQLSAPRSGTTPGEGGRVTGSFSGNVYWLSEKAPDFAAASPR